MRRGYKSARPRKWKLSRRRGQRRRKKKLTPVCRYICTQPTVANSRIAIGALQLGVRAKQLWEHIRPRRFGGDRVLCHNLPGYVGRFTIAV